MSVASEGGRERRAGRCEQTESHSIGRLCSLPEEAEEALALVRGRRHEHGYLVLVRHRNLRGKHQTHDRRESRRIGVHAGRRQGLRGAGSRARPHRARRLHPGFAVNLHRQPLAGAEDDGRALRQAAAARAQPRAHLPHVQAVLQPDDLDQPVADVCGAGQEP